MSRKQIISSPPSLPAGRPAPGAVMLAVILLAVLSVGCAVQPTPYQPLGREGGYEESRLQPNLFRVSFKANRETPETDVIDFLYLRSAEVTLKHGFTHFVVEKNMGRTEYSVTEHQTGPTFSFGMGTGRGNTFWGAGFGTGVGPTYYSASISYHLAIFVIRVLTPEEAKTHGDKALDAKFVVDSLSAKKEKSLSKGS